MPRRAKKNISWYKKACDKEFSLLIRSKGFCEWCGASNRKLDCAHIIPRGNQTLRYDPVNALSLCHVCHRFRAHADPLGFTEWFKGKYEKRYIYLMEYKNRITKRNINDYRVILKHLEEKNIKKLLTGNIDIPT